MIVATMRNDHKNFCWTFFEKNSDFKKLKKPGFFKLWLWGKSYGYTIKSIFIELDELYIFCIDHFVIAPVTTEKNAKN